MNNLISVEGHPNLFRDKTTGAIVNCDDISYKNYLNNVSNRLNTKKEIKNLKNEVEEIKNLKNEVEEIKNLKNEVEEIKSLLKEILNQSKKN